MRNQKDRWVDLLREAVAAGADELHLKAPQRPMFRVSGGLLPSDHAPLTAHDTQAAAYALCALANATVSLADVREQIFSFGLDRTGRFQAYLYRQRGSLALVVRPVATQVPTLDSLGSQVDPDEFFLEPGLVLVSGMRRDAFRAALVGQYNRTHCGHVAIVESRLRYLHQDQRAIVTQREVGADLADLPTGIRDAPRMGVDLLVTDDLDTPGAVRAALDIAEGDIPVIASVGAPSPEDAVWWVTRLFTGEEREVVEERLRRVLNSATAVQPSVHLRRPLRPADEAPLPNIKLRKSLLA
jgi:twitching motility protein PilT